MARENVPEGCPGTESDSVDRGQGTRNEEVLKGSEMVFAEGKGVKALYKELLKKKKAIKRGKEGLPNGIYGKPRFPLLLAHDKSLHPLSCRGCNILADPVQSDIL